MEIRIKEYQERIIETSYEKVYDQCLKFIIFIKNWKIKNIYKDEGKARIEVRTGISFRSWGEKLTIEIERVGLNKTKIRVTSKPLVPTTIIDYGKNNENVVSLISFLKTFEK